MQVHSNRMLLDKQTSSANIPGLSEETRVVLINVLSDRVQSEFGIALSGENLKSAIMELSFRS